MINFLKKLLDYLYKKRCYVCYSKKENNFLCSKCKDEIQIFNAKPQRIINDVEVYSATLYTKGIQQLIRGLKFQNKKDFDEILAKILYEFWQKSPKVNEKYYILTVPLHKNRLRKRKFNQSDLIAKEFAKLTGYEIKTNLIERIKDTKPQYQLNYEQRQNNLIDAFKVKKENYNNENLLIIDDIITTGATLQEIIKELKKSGIEKITILTLSTTQNEI